MGSAGPSGAATTDLATLLARQRAFLTGDVIIDLATADSAGVPLIAIGLGCAVALRPPRVSVLVESTQAAAFLAVLADTRRIAATFGRAPDHAAIQLKGTDCDIVEAGAAERRLAASYRDRLVRQLGLLGVSAAQTDVYLGLVPEALRVLRFTPRAIFQQTPGPQAGEPLR